MDVILREGEGKAFVRKWKKTKQGETTIILLMVKGDLPFFDDETMHVVEVVADEVNSVRIRFSGKVKTEKFKGYRIDQIMLQM